MMDDKEINELKETFKEHGLDLEIELAQAFREEIAKELAKESYTWDEWCDLAAALIEQKYKPEEER